MRLRPNPNSKSIYAPGFHALTPIKKPAFCSALIVAITRQFVLTTNPLYKLSTTFLYILYIYISIYI